MTKIQLSLLSVYAWMNVVVFVSAQTVTLSIGQIGRGASSPQMVQVGATIEFTCTLSEYSDLFSSIALVAKVSGSNITICSATTSGNCAPNSQGKPFQSRLFTVYMSSDQLTVVFSLSNAVMNDSLSYQCQVNAGKMTYLAMWSNLKVYIPPSVPSVSFVNSNNFFLPGAQLPWVTCTANSGSSNGTMLLAVSGQVGYWYPILTSGYLVETHPPYVAVMSYNSVRNTNGTYTITTVYAFRSYGDPTYYLSAVNDQTDITCFIANSDLLNSSLSYLSYNSSTLSINIMTAASGVTVSLNTTPPQHITLANNDQFSLQVPPNTPLVLGCYTPGDINQVYTWCPVKNCSIQSTPLPCVQSLLYEVTSSDVCGMQCIVSESVKIRNGNLQQVLSFQQTVCTVNFVGNRYPPTSTSTTKKLTTTTKTTTKTMTTTRKSSTTTKIPSTTKKS